MKSKQRLVILFGALAALLTFLVAVPLFGADATQRFPDSADTTKVVTWARQGALVNGFATDATSSATVILEVTDADLDLAQIVTTTAFATCSALQQFSVTFLTGGTGIGNSFATTSGTAIQTPILDRTGTSAGVTQADVTLNLGITSPAVSATSTSLTIFSVDPNTGITLQCNVGHSGSAFSLTYNKGAVDATSATAAAQGSIKVSSDLEPAGITVRLEETGAQTGIFRGTLKLVGGHSNDVSTTTSTCLISSCGAGNTTTQTIASLPDGDISTGRFSVGSLKVNGSDTLSVTYVDASSTGADVSRSHSITIETTAPSVANPLPANGTSQAGNQPTISADITDSDSLVDAADVRVIWGFDTGTAEGELDNVVESTASAADLVAISSGQHLELRLASGDAKTLDHVIYWWIRSVDTAGNVGITDRTPITAAGVADPCNSSEFIGIDLKYKNVDVSTDIAGCQPYSVSVDQTAPDLSAAVTGSWWDTGLTTDDKTVTFVTTTLDTSIRVDFDAPVDQTTVDRTDFEVDDSTPLDIATYAARTGTVFLTVPALAPDARPKIEVVGEIKDTAGNKLTSDSIASAVDGIAPTLTLTVDSTARPVTKASVTITINSNERGNVGTAALQVGRIVTTTVPSITQVPVTGTPLVVTGTISPGTQGLYNVYATMTDLNVTTNTGNVGKNPAGQATIDLTTATLFEVDLSIPTPSYLPTGTTDDANAIVSIDFTNEGAEYGLDSGGAASVTPSDILATGGTNYDTYKTVTIDSAILDGVDILADLSTADNIRFLYKPPAALVVGDHTIKVTATDLATNKVVFATHTFKVAARAEFTVPLVPGWNMISFPADPVDPAIDAVIPPSVPVSVVMAYDAATGVWLTATREKDATGTFGAFVGNLSTINSLWGYWAFTETFQSISTLIPRLAGGAPSGATPPQPPTVSIVIGWNLVPVLDVTGDATSGGASDLVANAYFASLADVTRVYNFDTQLNKWSAVDITSTSLSEATKIEHGKSYWLYSTKAGVLAP